ncbi:FAD synthase [Porphyridium purpureum]|uniref:FAD synthase n=1 Tax=Porphyridium purpureum TaxID=35688 RepID=A0A5J4Z182_PORPP|nr:FAD synthase [Porphyridium purpureum]|eukprot:POR8176..scf208_2
MATAATAATESVGGGTDDDTMIQGLALYSAIRSYEDREDTVDRGFAERLNASLDTLESALHVYTPERVSLAFNGGKDITCVLHLYRAAIANYSLGRDGDEEISCEDQSNEKRVPPIMNAVYLSGQDDFPEIENFVRSCANKYKLNIVFQRGGYKAGLKEYVKNTGVMAFVLGTRRTDPDGKNLTLFAPSTKNYVPFMRVNPILEWRYGDVWRFLRGMQLPYCKLYDAGFTSLGSRADSRKNPSLLLPDGSYMPAYKLFDEQHERSGRGKGEAAAAVASTSSVEIQAQVEHAPVSHVNTCAIILVGDELLSGKMPEKNLFGASQMLRDAGVSLERVSMVRDSREEIAREVARFVNLKYDLVFTSGGVGATHDDLTYEGIADAFGDVIVRNMALEKVVMQYCGSSSLKMSDIPSTSALVYTGHDFPVVCIRDRVFALPGIPEYFEIGLKAVLEKHRSTRRFYCVKIYLGVDEREVVNVLKEAARLLPVHIGSYPMLNREDCRTIITVESEQALELQKCLLWLRGKLEPYKIINIEKGNDLTAPPTPQMNSSAQIFFELDETSESLQLGPQLDSAESLRKEFGRAVSLHLEHAYSNPSETKKAEDKT